MKHSVRWKREANYRMFLAESVKQASLVSSRLIDEVSGVVIDETLLLVSDNDGQFCDLELVLREESACPELIDLGEVSVAAADVATRFDSDSKVSWSCDRALKVIQIRLGGDRPLHWVELGEGHVVLGVGKNDTVVVIHCPMVQFDPTGSLEQKWLAKR